MDLALGVGLRGDLVQDQRRALIGGDQVLGHGDPQQQEDLLARALDSRRAVRHCPVASLTRTLRSAGSTLISE